MKQLWIALLVASQALAAGHAFAGAKGPLNTAGALTGIAAHSWLHDAGGSCRYVRHTYTRTTYKRYVVRPRYRRTRTTYTRTVTVTRSGGSRRTRTVTRRWVGHRRPHHHYWR